MQDNESNDELESPLGWTEALGEHGSNPAVVRASGDVIFALGGEWKVSSLENRIKAQFEQWVRLGARRCIADAEKINAAEANDLRSTYQQDYAAGAYNWGGGAVQRAVRELAGVKQLLFLLMKRCNKNLTEAQAEKVFLDNPRGCADSIRWALGNAEAPQGGGAQKAIPATMDD